MTTKIRSHIQGKNIKVNKKMESYLNWTLLTCARIALKISKLDKKNKKKTKNNELLELIHIDIYGPFDIPS